MKLLRLIFLLFFTTTIAQNIEDNEAKRLENLCRKHSRTPDSLSFYGKQLLKYGKTNDNLKAILEGYFALGFSSSLESKNKVAITYLDSAIAYKEEATTLYFSEMMRIMRNKAIIYKNSGESNKARDLYDYILKECLANNKIVDAAYIYNNIGVLEKNRANMEAAILYYKKALHILDSIGEERNKSAFLLNIGIAQANIKDIEKSNRSFYQALELANKYNLKRDKFKAYNNLSVNFTTLKKYDSANYFLRKVLPYYKAKKNRFSSLVAYQNMGRNFMHQQQNDSAKIFLTKANKGFKLIENPKKTIESYNQLMELAFKTKKYNEVLRLEDSILQFANNENLKITIKNAYGILAKTYEELEDYKKANAYLKLEEKINEEIFELENAKSLNQIIVDQEVNQKNKKIKTLVEGKTIYKNNLIILLVISFLILIALAKIYINYDKGKKEINQLQEKLNQYNTQTKTKKPNYFTLKSKTVLNTKELLYIKSDGHYVEYFIDNKKKPEIDRNSLSEVLRILPSNSFVRIHKSFVVNIHRIKIINSTKVMLDNGVWINLSRTYKQQLKDILHKED